jgi:hypothetical protein
MIQWVSNTKRLISISILLPMFIFVLYISITYQIITQFLFALIISMVMLGIVTMKLRVSKTSIESNWIFIKMKINPKDVKKINIMRIWGRQLILQGEKGGVVISLAYVKNPKEFLQNIINLVMEYNSEVVISNEIIDLYGKPPYKKIIIKH